MKLKYFQFESLASLSLSRWTWMSMRNHNYCGKYAINAKPFKRSWIVSFFCRIYSFLLIQIKHNNFVPFISYQKWWQCILKVFNFTENYSLICARKGDMTPIQCLIHAYRRIWCCFVLFFFYFLCFKTNLISPLRCYISDTEVIKCWRTFKIFL